MVPAIGRKSNQTSIPLLRAPDKTLHLPTNKIKGGKPESLKMEIDLKLFISFSNDNLKNNTREYRIKYIQKYPVIQPIRNHPVCEIDEAPSIARRLVTLFPWIAPTKALMPPSAIINLDSGPLNSMHISRQKGGIFCQDKRRATGMSSKLLTTLGTQK